MARPGSTGEHRRGSTGPRRGALASEPKQFCRLQDAVYREMYLLEAGKPSAAMGLALALLRACAGIQGLRGQDECSKWLKTIVPICLEMIEDSLGRGDRDIPASPSCAEGA